MDDNACPLPTPPAGDERSVMDRLLSAQRIAVVGASDDPSRAGNYVPDYLLRAGKQVFPVNPNHDRVLNQPCHKTLSDVPRPIDLVLVFRRPEFCPAVAEDAVRAGAKALWLQSGIRSAEARRIAQSAGLDYIEDRCLMVEHSRRR